MTHLHILAAALYQCGDISTSSSMTTKISLSLQVQAWAQALMIPRFSLSSRTIFSPWLNLNFCATFLTKSPYKEILNSSSN